MSFAYDLDQEKLHTVLTGGQGKITFPYTGTEFIMQYKSVAPMFDALPLTIWL